MGTSKMGADRNRTDCSFKRLRSNFSSFKKSIVQQVETGEGYIYMDVE